MSKYKNSLPENVDLTSPQEPDYIPDTPSPSDVAVNTILSNISLLERDLPIGYEDELDEAIDRLGRLYERVRAPF